MELYNISNLSYSYPGSDMNALSDISLKINKGEFVILCGSSGSGKSTLLNLMKAPADAGTQKEKFLSAVILPALSRSLPTSRSSATRFGTNLPSVRKA